MAKMLILVILLSFMLMSALAATQAEKDRFTRLPGAAEDMPSHSYSGYLDISKEKSIHYVFVESESDPEKDPVMVWFNGGPGCSSMMGFLQEHGPMVIDDGSKKVVRNPHPWNKRANMIYLESPAGVGFSTHVEKDKVVYTDEQVAVDALKALTMWYERFPKFGWSK